MLEQPLKVRRDEQGQMGCCEVPGCTAGSPAVQEPAGATLRASGFSALGKLTAQHELGEEWQGRLTQASEMPTSQGEKRQSTLVAWKGCGFQGSTCWVLGPHQVLNNRVSCSPPVAPLDSEHLSGSWLRAREGPGAAGGLQRRGRRWHCPTREPRLTCL